MVYLCIVGDGRAANGAGIAGLVGTGGGGVAWAGEEGLQRV